MSNDEQILKELKRIRSNTNVIGVLLFGIAVLLLFVAAAAAM